VHAAENSSVFLGHLPGRRAARGIRDVGPGTLLVIDEASMMSMPDLLEIIAHAARRGAKVLIAGDQEQLAAVESGGGMMLLARRMGFVQLAEAVRFTAGWERDASLRLRAGDASVLDVYHEHGRIRGAVPEQAMDDAVRRAAPGQRRAGWSARRGRRSGARGGGRPGPVACRPAFHHPAPASAGPAPPPPRHHNHRAQQTPPQHPDRTTPRHQPAPARAHTAGNSHTAAPAAAKHP